MDTLIAQLVLALPTLAAILPAVAGAIAVVHLWRWRRSPGSGLAFPSAAAAVMAVLGVLAALVFIQLSYMFTPSRSLDAQDALVSVGVGLLIALSGLAGYTVLRRHGPGAGFGFVLGPLVLMAAPLLLAQVAQELARGSLYSAHMDAARARGSQLALAVDSVSASMGAEGQIDEVRLHVTISSDRAMSLVPSDSELEHGLLQFQLVPPGEGPDSVLYAQSPIGTPRGLAADVAVEYDLRFDGLPGAPRPGGQWELVVSWVSDGELYERFMTIPVAIAN